MSSLPVISGMSVRQVAADTVDTWCAAFTHIFYSECFQGPSATPALPPTTSNQYIINTHYARMHIYRARLDKSGTKDDKRACVAVLVRVGVLAVRSAGFLLWKEKKK